MIVLFSNSMIKFSDLTYISVSISVLLFFTTGNRVHAIKHRNLLQDNSDDVDCNLANLSVLAYDEMNSIKVNFKLTHFKYNHCFQVFYILVVKQNETGKFYSDFVRKRPSESDLYEPNEYSYIFENVTCGSYNIYIQPCWSKLQCTLLIMDYPTLINVTNGYCSPSLGNTARSDFKIRKEITIGLAVSSLVIIIAVSGWIYFNFCSGNKLHKNRSESLEYTEENKMLAKPDIHVYILHYYDERGDIEQKVQTIKDFLVLSSYFISIKTIEDELARSLFDVNDWSKNMLETINKDGSMKKIVLIDSEKFEDEEHEMENILFSYFIKELSENRERIHTDYNNLFVVQLDDITPSETMRTILQWDRYCIPRISHHLNDLCLNLTFVSKSNIPFQ